MGRTETRAVLADARDVDFAGAWAAAPTERRGGRRVAAEHVARHARLLRAMTLPLLPTFCRGVVAAAMAAAVAGCSPAPAMPSPPPAASPSSATPTPEVSTTGYMVPWTDATPSPVPSPTQVVIPAGTPTCAPGDLAATAGWQGATGQMVGWLDLTNTGQHACVLSGSPRLVQLRSGTTILTQLAYQAGKDAGPGSETGAAGPCSCRRAVRRARSSCGRTGARR
jgi:hypothetical protein